MVIREVVTFFVADQAAVFDMTDETDAIESFLYRVFPLEGGGYRVCGCVLRIYPMGVGSEPKGETLADLVPVSEGLASREDALTWMREYVKGKALDLIEHYQKQGQIVRSEQHEERQYPWGNVTV